jgi:REP-associated tyrosine transposase
MDRENSAVPKPALPKRKPIRLPRVDYANPASVFNLTIDAEQRQRYFVNPQFNGEVIAVLRGDAVRCGCPIRIYCLMPTHLHLLAQPGSRSLIEFVGAFKKKTAGLARETRGIKKLWQRSFFDHRLRSHESEMEQYEYIRMNPVRAGLVDHPDGWPWTGSVEIS